MKASNYHPYCCKVTLTSENELELKANMTATKRESVVKSNNFNGMIKVYKGAVNS